MPLHLLASEEMSLLSACVWDGGRIQILNLPMALCWLHLACWYGHDNIVGLLLRNAANIHIENEDGDKPLDLAQQMKRIVIIKMIKKYRSSLDQNAEASSGHIVKSTNQISITIPLPLRHTDRYNKNFESISYQEPQIYNNCERSGSRNQRQLDRQSCCQISCYTTSSTQPDNIYGQQSSYSTNLAPVGFHKQDPANHHDYCPSIGNGQSRLMTESHYSYRNHESIVYPQEREISQCDHYYTRTNGSIHDCDNFLRKKESFLQDSADEESHTSTEHDPEATKDRQPQQDGQVAKAQL